MDAATPPTSAKDVIILEVFLTEFCANQSRGLTPRGRRFLAEIIELLQDYLEERDVHTVGRRAAPEVLSLAQLLDHLDVFETDEVADAFEGNREQLRIADVALRGLTRQLRSKLG